MVALLLALVAVSRVVITEVMANPLGSTGAHAPEDRNEFVELYNPTQEAVDLMGWILDDLDGSLDRLIAWRDSSILGANPTAIINYTWLGPGKYAVVLDSEYTDPAPVGGYEQPYRFGDSCLILTTANTTIGNGLATTDPLVLASPYGDTSTFGTPAIPNDNFPANPGDGFSWERIDQVGPDIISNWATCSDGCTPGGPNLASTVPNLSVSELRLAEPESLRPGQSFRGSVLIANVGFIPTQNWFLDVFLDRNGNSARDPSEECWHTNGWPLLPGEDSVVEFTLTGPRTTTDLWARITCEGDRDTVNNRLRLTLNPSVAGRLLSLATSSFSPDQDGYEDSLEVVYRLPRAGGKLRIVIFDLAGRVCRELLDAKTETGQGLVVWDGRNASGRIAAGGIYAVWLSYHLPDGDWVEKMPVVLER